MKEKVNINRWRDTGTKTSQLLAVGYALLFFSTIEKPFICNLSSKQCHLIFQTQCAHVCACILFMPNNNCQWGKKKLCKFMCVLCVVLYIICLVCLWCICSMYHVWTINKWFSFFTILWFFLRTRHTYYARTNKNEKACVTMSVHNEV